MRQPQRGKHLNGQLCPFEAAFSLGLAFTRATASSSQEELPVHRRGRRSKGEVVAEELHDEGAVAVRILAEAVKLDHGVVEGLLGEVAGAVGRVEDLVVEHGEVEGQAEADGVRRGELGLGNVGGVLQVLSEACL